MLKKVTQKTKDFFANLIKALSSAKSSAKGERANTFVNFFGSNKKERLKKISVLISFAIIATLAITFSLIASITKVVINDGENTACVYTLRSNPVDVLSTVDFIEGDYTITSVNKTSDDTVINLRYTFPVYVTCGEKTTEVSFMQGDTVAKAIELAGITLDEYDIVNLSLTKKLFETTYIDVTDVNYITDSYTKAIPYEKKTVYSNTVSKSEITTSGVDGEKKITTVTKLVNGVEESKNIVSEEIVKNPIDQIYTVSTGSTTKSSSPAASKKPVNTISVMDGNVELDSNGNPVNFKKHITVQATAYTGDHSTASGMAPRPGCVAVNPKIFGYGTKFYIKSSDGRFVYGYSVAADTGGFVKSRPTNFDLYFNTEAECEAFGRRNIEVWVVE